jgi:hypothetical protein
MELTVVVVKIGNVLVGLLTTGGVTVSTFLHDSR